MKFKSIWEEKVILNPCSSGDTVRIEYVKDVDVNGEPVIKKVGEYDIRKTIQSYADQCSIKRIVERASLGDLSVLNVNKPLNDINNGSDLDLTFMEGKTAEELNNYQNVQIYNLYQSYAGKDKVSIEDFKKYVLAGDFKTLDSLAVKEEVNE